MVLERDGWLVVSQLVVGENSGVQVVSKVVVVVGNDGAVSLCFPVKNVFPTINSGKILLVMSVGGKHIKR